MGSARHFLARIPVEQIDLKEGVNPVCVLFTNGAWEHFI